MKRGKAGKKKIIIILLIVLVLAVAAGIAFFVVRGRMAQSSMMPTSSARTAEVTKGNLSTTVVGTGTLAAETAEEMKIPVGITIDEVYVEEGDEVSKGDVLATVDKASLLESMDTVLDTIDELEDEIDEYDSDTYEYAIAVAKKDNYEEKYQELEALEETYEIVAEYSGTVESVSISAGSTVSAGSSSSSSSGTQSTTGNSAGAVTGVSYQTGSKSMTATGMSCFTVVSEVEVENSDAEPQTTAAQEDDQQAVATSEDGSSSAVTASVDDTISTLTAITACSPSIAAPVIGETPQSTIMDMVEYTGTISWATSNSSFQEGTSYVATVVLTAQSGYYFKENVQVRYSDASVTSLAVDPEAESNRISFVLTFPTLTQETSQQSNSSNSNSDSQVTVEENSTSNNTESAGGEQQSAAGSTQNSSGTDSQTSGSSVSGSISTDSSESDSQSTIENVNQELTTAFTIAGNNNMILSVDVDELDILSIALDQKAEIVFDALEDQTFEGTITSISDTATTSSGGVSKYAVEVTIPRSDDMRQGMNASATIVVENKNDILLVPVSAIQEKGDASFVYTQEDSESGQLSGEVEVETGISDGDQVEIVSGLTEGQTIYYNRSESTSDSSGENGMPDMGGFSGGEMPDMSGSGGFSGGGNRSGNMGSGNMGGGGPQ